MTSAIEAAYPLAPMQQGLLFQSLMEPGSGVYVAQVCCRLGRDTDLAALQRAWDTVLQRHDILRTSFDWQDREPRQRVHANVGCAIERYDWRDLSADGERAWLAADRQRGFDLAEPPLMRVAAGELPEGEHLMVWTHHHLLLDGRARVVVLKEVDAFYRAYRTQQNLSLPDPPRFEAYIDWLRSQPEGDGAAFWRNLFGESFTPVSLSAALGGAADPPPVAVPRQRVPVSRDVQSALQRMARANDVTVNIVVQAAWAVLLSRYTGSPSVTFGATRSCRRARFDDIANVVGVVMNTLPHHLVVHPDAPFPEVVASLRAQHVAMRDHQHTSMPRIREWSGVDTSRPLFDTVINFEDRDLNESLQAAEPGLWRGGVHRVVHIASGVTLAGYARPELRLEVACRPEFCPAGAPRRLSEHFARLLESVAANPGARVRELAILTEADRIQIEAWNATDRVIPQSTVPLLLDTQAARSPSATALICGDTSLNYAELHERANRLAHLLIGLGIGVEARVVVAIPRSVDLAVALIGTLKAGGVCVPLDLQQPADRVAAMLDEVRPACVLSTAGVVLDVGHVRHLRLDAPEVTAALAACRTDPPRDEDRTHRLHPLAAAYVMFTSGSTGAPKGIAIPHTAIANKVVTIAQFLGLDAHSRFALTSSIGFDPLFDQLLCPLVVGGTCVVVPEPVRQDAEQCGPYLARHGGTVVNGTPDFMRHVLAGGALAVDTLMVGGDVLTETFAAELVSAGVARRILNLYGPTETCINASAYEVAAGQAGAVPIGAPLPNYRLYVLDGQLQPVPIGVTGELYIAGAGVGRGYVGRSAATALRFIADPWGTGTRLYRSGDRARWRADGVVEFLGRTDRQVKIRGVRIEPAEIEHVLAAHPAVERAIVTVRPAAAAGEPHLCAYVVLRRAGVASADALRQFLLRTLPAAFVPAHLVVLDAFPLTATGKVDPRALPAPVAAPALGRVDLTPEEEVLCALFADVLGRDAVTVDDNFFALGGHSLLATRLISRVRSTLGAEVPIRTVFETPTPAGLAARIRSVDHQRPLLTAAARSHPLPLSYPQQRLWFIDSLDPGSAEYNVTVALRLRGSLDVAALRRAMQAIIDRHEALRTHFGANDAEAFQVIAPTLDLPMVAEDRDVDDLDETVRQESEGPFDLSRGPLIRVRLLRLGPDDHVLVRTCHHIVSDGWSQAVFNREMSLLYEAFSQGLESPLPPLPVQYADFALWQHAWLESGGLDEGLAYWSRQLAGAPEQLALPTDRPRPVRRSPRSGHHELHLEPQLVAALKHLANDRNATLYMTMLASLAVLLARYAQEDEVVVGSPIANRQDSLLEGLVGCFLNTLALRIPVSSSATFGELLADVRRTTLDAYRYQDVPFERVVAAAMPRRSLSTSPIFQAMLTLQNAPVHPLSLSGLSVEAMSTPPRVHYDLELYGRERDGRLALSWVYDADLFDAWRVEQIASHYRQLLWSVAKDANQPVGRISLLDDRERREILEEWIEPARELGDATLADLFEAQVRRTPDAAAVVTTAGTLSYAQLAARARRLARVLVAEGAAPERVIGIALEPSLDMAVATLGVLLSGAAYLPLDPEYPHERLALMTKHAAPLLVLTTRALRQRLPSPGLARLMDDPAFEATLANTSAEALTNAERRGALFTQHPAYVLFTSGSTGVPKGVVGRHEGVVNRLAWFADRFGYGAGAVLGRSSMSFVDGATELLGPLLHGGSVVVAGRESRRSLDQLAALVAQHRIAMCTVVPTLLRELIDAAPARQLESCRLWITSGEPLAQRDAERFATLLPRARLLNLYGASEASGDSLFAECQSGHVTIGLPIWNTPVYVLDAALTPVPVGVPGDLFLGGSGLARGYLGRAGFTAERFLASPFGAPGSRLYRTGDLARWTPDGALQFVGRADRQVKIRGMRVEPGEIEAILRTHPAVADAIVVADEQASAAPLVGYAIPRPGQRIDSALLRQHLRATVPEHMVPAAIVGLPHWPLTPTGKLDRAALRVELPAAEWQAPASADEDAICAIFAEVLGRERVSRTDDFFDLGGHSLLAMRLVNRIRARVGIECAITSVFESPSPASLAARLRQDQPAKTAVF